MNVMMLLEMASAAFPSARHLPTAALVPVSPTSSYLTPRGKGLTASATVVLND